MLKDPFAVVDSLVTDRELVFQFFFFFSRFEYALKRSPGFLKKQERAEADWDEYCNSIRHRFGSVETAEFKAASEYLQKNPPGVQVVETDGLGWKPASRGDGESTERYLLRLVQTVRNNLFHGGKYPYPTCAVTDVARNRELLKACIAVLKQCLALSPDVGGRFEERLAAQRRRRRSRRRPLQPRVTFRPEGDVRSHFAGFAYVLDSALELARPSLAADGVTVYDHSNRTGFDKSGMGNPTWEYEFERRHEAGSFIAKSVARIMYVESFVRDVPSSFESCWVAEVFQLGSLPAFREEQRQSVSLEGLRGTGLLGRVTELLGAAERSFPPALRLTSLLPAVSEGR